MNARRAVWLALAALAALYFLARGVYYVGYFNDDAFYLIGAKSLLHGRYANLHLPGQPPMIQYTPGYPLLLAGALGLTGGSLAAAQLMGGAFLVAALALLDPLWRDELPLTARLGAMALAGLSPLFVSLSGAIMAEGAYLFWTALTLRAAARFWDKKELRIWAAMGLLAGFGALIRPNGIVLPLALAAALALEKRRGPALTALIAGALPAALFFLRNRQDAGFGSTYALELMAPISSAGFNGEATLIAENAWFYAREALARGFFRCPSFPGAIAAEILVVLGAAWASWKGFKSEKRDGWRKLPWLHMALYFAALLPWYKQSDRYVLPLLPFLAVLILRGTPRRAFWAVASLALALSIWADWLTLRTTWSERNSINSPPTRTYSWIASRTDPRAVFATEMNGRLYLYTGRRCVRPPAAGNDVELTQWARDQGVNYFLFMAGDGGMVARAGDAARFPQEVMANALAHSALFKPVYVDRVERAAIFRVQRTISDP